MSPTEQHTGVDIDAMKRDKEDHEGGKGCNWPEGDCTAYVLPPRGSSKVPYAEYAIHRVGVGRGQTTVCFNPKRNPMLKNEKFIAIVNGMGIKIPKSCKICQKVEAENLWDTNEQEAMRISAKGRFVWLVIMWAKRASAKDNWSDISPKRVKPFYCPKGQWDEICDLFCDLGDITDPSKAKLFKMTRVGAKEKTRYSAAGDFATAATPLVLSKEVRGIVAKALTDPELSYEKLIADLVVSPEEIDALMQGVQTEDVAEGDATPEVKPCLGQKALFNPSDPECAACEYLARCRQECGEGEPTAPAAPVEEPVPPVEDPPHLDEEAPAEEPAPEAPPEEFKFENLEPTGTLCSVCKTPQAEMPDGQVTCVNGHGGAPAYVKPAKVAPVAPAAVKAAPAAAPKAPAPAQSKAEQATATKTAEAGAKNITRLDALLAQRGAKKA